VRARAQLCQKLGLDGASQTSTTTGNDGTKQASTCEKERPQPAMAESEVEDKKKAISLSLYRDSARADSIRRRSRTVRPFCAERSQKRDATPATG